MGKVVVIGAGASGTLAAIYAAKNGNDVTVIDRNASPLKKLLITGNGKCNYANEHFSSKYYTSYNKEILEKIINEECKDEILNFFKSAGIVPKIKNGYYYPRSGTAHSVKNAIVLEAQKQGVQFINDILVTKIEKKEKFIINDRIEADVVVLATGGMAAPKTGSDGSGYTFAKAFHHGLKKPLPALVKLKGNEKYFKDWAKTRSDVRVSLYIDDVLVKEECGEIQLTDTGISGVCVFNLSALAVIGLSSERKVDVHICFAPFCVSKLDLKIILEQRSKTMNDRNMEEFLEGFLHYRIVKVILDKCHINANAHYNELSEEKRETLVNNLFDFKLNITGFGSFEEAQVSSGGVPIEEINPETMESLKTKNLYLTGEILDVSGDCGGYNLMFAFITGMLAGRSIK